ncbi:response regulator transcription factor [Streptacidiphilus sp. ASG 303]|uniref:response regulator transcription factor n=1 Tax=Streptacidiphilus sp. ASG 303 TaxID=2896847 RepID=UPI001E34AB74|nr:response regulator transcription factor [Streptacidiphilus sp. ASG 303]MCD0484779.1 response regulator transcription factor [Streptacidiphilus sp. ASG 303]
MDTDPAPAGTAGTRNVRPRLAVIGCDTLSAEGADAYFRSSRPVVLLDPDHAGEADVVLVLTRRVTDELLIRMEELRRTAANPAMRFVMVADAVDEPRLVRAVGCGLVALLPRASTTFSRVTEAVLRSAQGKADLPDTAVRALVEEIGSIQQNVLAPRNLTPSGLSTREVDILRLLAEGFDLAEIAAKLHYSERTIKSTIHGVLTRLSLRNRVHAVAYAFRRGLL